MQPNTFLQELGRRSIFRVAVMYTVATWVLLQVGDVLSDPLSLPGWFQSTLIGLLVIGFPITLLLEYETWDAGRYLVWLPSLQAFRRSDAFKRLMRKTGVVTYWQKHGWPDLCRPKEPDDFVCN